MDGSKRARAANEKRSIAAMKNLSNTASARGGKKKTGRISVILVGRKRLYPSSCLPIYMYRSGVENTKRRVLWTPDFSGNRCPQEPPQRMKDEDVPQQYFHYCRFVTIYLRRHCVTPSPAGLDTDYHILLIVRQDSSHILVYPRQKSDEDDAIIVSTIPPPVGLGT